MLLHSREFSAKLHTPTTIQSCNLSPMTSKVSPTRISIKKIIKKQNAFIKDTSIILVYKVEEGKFTQLIENSKYVQSMDITNESQTKGKYFTITINTDYKNAVKEVKGMIKYVYLDREEDERQEYQRNNTPIIYSNVLSYSQVLMVIYMFYGPNFR